MRSAVSIQINIPTVLAALADGQFNMETQGDEVTIVPATSGG